MNWTAAEQAQLSYWHSRVNEETQRLLTLAGAADLVFTIRFDLRGTNAGQARLDAERHCTIRYHPLLLLRYGEAFIAQTVPHEVAHCLVFLRYGHRAKPHGAEWRALMRQFGAAPRRCHEYAVADLPRRQLRHFAYRCACRVHYLTAIRHQRVLRGRHYLCKRCGAPLSAVTGAQHHCLRPVLAHAGKPTD